MDTFNQDAGVVLLHMILGNKGKPVVIPLVEGIDEKQEFNVTITFNVAAKAWTVRASKNIPLETLEVV